MSKIKKLSAADLVFDELKTYILNHTWKTGEKIPSETEISKQLGVNRLTARIALQRLNALGLLDIRVGDGTYVREFNMNTHIAELSDFYVTDNNIKEVVEYRLALTQACIPLAVQRATEEELEKFHKLCKQFKEELDQYYQEADPVIQRDLFLKNIDTVVEMNMTICSMAHNELFEYAFVLSMEPLRRHMEYNASKRIAKLPDEELNSWVIQWEQLYQSLKNRNTAESLEIVTRIIQS